LLRGGREGLHHVTPAASSDAARARQRLALEQFPEYRVRFEVPSERFNEPTRIQPKFRMPGNGFERWAEGEVPVKIIEVWEYK